MTSTQIENLLAHDFVKRYPSEAAKHLEAIPRREASTAISLLEPRNCSQSFATLPPTIALDILSEAEPQAAGALLQHLTPTQAGPLLGALPRSQREDVLECMSPLQANELRRIMTYPPESAGRFMDARIPAFRSRTTVSDALARLRVTHPDRSILNLFLIDDFGKLVGVVPLYQAALAEPDSTLDSLIEGSPVTVPPFATRAEIVETMERHQSTSLPVVEAQGRPIGVLRLNELMQEVGKELSADLVSMTGASKEEAALSSPQFAVRSRLPWLLINLVTAFAAASVVGLFEDTIAKFTALAVLLPVVAGQSGNTGSQALAVVLRGLALREITLRYWPRVVVKEFVAGSLNGVGVGVVTCASVYLWSGSIGLVLVIGIAMVLSMAVAGIAGAIIPLLLTAAGRDAAQSSSILLTTVTDVVGFFSFLGLAVVFADLI